MSSRRKVSKGSSTTRSITTTDATKRVAQDRIDSDREDDGDVDNSMFELATSSKKPKNKTTTTTPTDTNPHANETVEEYNLRLKREFLQMHGIATDSDEDEEQLVDNDSDYANDSLAQKLRNDALMVSGKQVRTSLTQYINFDNFDSFTPLLDNCNASGTTLVPLYDFGPVWIDKKHKRTITSLTLSDDSTFAITGSDGGQIHKHLFYSRNKNIQHQDDEDEDDDDNSEDDDYKTSITKQYKQPLTTIISSGPTKAKSGHYGAVYAVTVSSCNTFLATGGEDSSVRLWNLNTNLEVDDFKKNVRKLHKAAVYCVKFNKGSLNLYSAGQERDVHMYDCQKHVYMGTLYGPSAPTMAMDCLHMNRLFVGGRDCIPRIINPEMETITPFKGRHAELLSVDAIAAIDSENFVTGSQTNTIQLWNRQFDKARSTIRDAHAASTMAPQRVGTVFQTATHPIENWITAIAAVEYKDLVFSGSSDGYIRAWKADIDSKQLHPLFNIPVQGFVNGLQVDRDGKFLLAAIGKTNRLGNFQGRIVDNVIQGLYCFDLTKIYQQGYVDAVLNK